MSFELDCSRIVRFTNASQSCGSQYASLNVVDAENFQLNANRANSRTLPSNERKVCHY